MHHHTRAARFAAAAFAVCTTPVVFATDYFVSTSGSDSNDGLTAEAAFATIDKAVVTATSASDAIFVSPGEYATSTQYGPNLVSKLVGTGDTRDDVVIRPEGAYRTLRMAAGSWLGNVTVVGNGDISRVDKGGAIEMSGGTVTNCIVRDGTSYAKNNVSGGNIYINNDAALVVDCVISGGRAKKRGGNVYLDHGTVRDCVIRDGVCEDNIGGNVYQYQGTISRCEIYGGTALNDGGNVRMNGAGVLEDCFIHDGTVQANEKKGANVYMDSGSKMSRCRLLGGTNESGYDSASLCVYSAAASVEDVLVSGSACGGVLLGAESFVYNLTIAGNSAYGIWSWTATQHIFNTVIFGNVQNGATRDWAGNQPTAAKSEFLNCAITKGSLSTAAFPTLKELSADDFADAEAGDWHPAAGSALLDGGVSDPRGAAASAADLDGNLRTSGVIDIGCYEVQKAEMIVHIDDAVYSQAHAPATVTFSHSTDNSASPENIVFTYDFGDGSEPESTTEATIAHTYAAPGVYTVKISAANDCDEEEAEMVYEGYARVASSTVYVTPGNSSSGVFPYDTPEKGYGNLKTAVQNALDGYTLLLGEGVHTTVDQVSFNKALTIRGTGATPEAVIVRNTIATPDTYYHRVLEINNVNGRIENITIENGCVRNQFGGNLRLVTGVVSNCVIRGGLAVADGGNGGGGGVELAGAGTLTHCVVSNNVVEGSSSSGNYAGGAIIVAYNAKNGRISNCLVAGNRYIPSGDVKAGAAGIRYIGSNDNAAVENCTVAGNVVEGSVKDDSAGIHCTTWYGRLRNNLVIGNYETGKGRYTAVMMDIDHGTYLNNVTEGNPDLVFKDFADGDYRPRTSSPAYDAGTLSGLYLQPEVDLSGAPRVFGRTIDAGCYESQALAATVFLIR